MSSPRTWPYRAFRLRRLWMWINWLQICWRKCTPTIVRHWQWDAGWTEITPQPLSPDISLYIVNYVHLYLDGKRDPGLILVVARHAAPCLRSHWYTDPRPSSSSRPISLILIESDFGKLTATRVSIYLWDVKFLSVLIVNIIHVLSPEIMIS